MKEDLAEQSEYSGIGGWLVFSAIGLIVGPFLQGWYAMHLIFIFTGNSWTILTDPNSSAYNYFWKPSLIFEFAGHLFFLCYLIAMLILFFGHRRLFPRLMIIFCICQLIYTIVDLYFCERISFLVQHSGLVEKGGVAIMRAALICLIWIPYFCVSKRVKNTFVE